MKILPAHAQLFRLMLIALMAMVTALLVGCQPSEQQIAAAREEKRLVQKSLIQYWTDLFS